MTRDEALLIVETARKENKIADLYRADLRGADLRGADLDRANLGGADLGDVCIRQIGPIGSRRDYLVMFKQAGEPECVTAGCWSGTLDAFAARVDEVYPASDTTRHGQDYRAAIVMLRAMLAVQEREGETA